MFQFGMYRLPNIKMLDEFLFLTQLSSLKTDPITAFPRAVSYRFARTAGCSNWLREDNRR
jgi:hypothetical protein